MTQASMLPNSRATPVPPKIDYGVTRSGHRQLRRQWSCGNVPKAVVLIVHGLAEHSGRYLALAAQFTDSGFAVVSYDQRGHGETSGREGHVDSFTEFGDDLEDHLLSCRQVRRPVVVLGHSMGGLISLGYALDEDRPKPDLLVLSAPALATPTPQILKLAASKLAQLAPKLFLRSVIDASMLSRDPEVIQAYRQDPLMRQGASVQLLSSLLAAGDAASLGADRLEVPCLCLHGGDDRLILPDASAVLDSVACVEREVLEGLRHEIFNEPEGPTVVNRVIDWVSRRI